LSNLRLADRLPEKLPSDPMHWADAWLEEAIAGQVQRNPNAMTLVTVGANHRPSARIVLCKSFVPDPGYAVMYTNYRSRKGRDIEGNPNVSLVFHWDSVGRQVRIEGIALRSPAAESDAYFESRDRGSRLGAWASDQSQPIASRDALVAKILQRADEFGLPPDSADGKNPEDDGIPHIPRPPHWGGYRIWASTIELWIEGKDRIHERAVWTRELIPAGEDGFSVSPWIGTRLQP
jgi:pyridoxamine 5'-phosphate oxidase